MERLKVKELKEWANDKTRKPLIIWGARQVGKTYLIKNLFLEENYKSYVYIDLMKEQDDNSFFSTTNRPEDYLNYIELKYNLRPNKDIPLVFDEVQFCPNVISTLKYFCQDFREIPVIATGSMVRLSLESKPNNFMFPVGKIDSIYLYPMNFEEYLLNTNKVLLERIKQAYKNKTPLLDYEHDKAIDLLYEYLSIGGMPEVVDSFIKNKSYIDAIKIRKELYDNYIDDMASYNTSQEMIIKTRNIYKNIFNQLNKTNENFKIGLIEKGKSNRDYFNAYRWLENANIIYRSNRKNGNVTLPLIDEESGLFRLYLFDVGLFSYQSKISDIDFFVKDKRNTLSGIFYENYVASEFASKGIPLFYWTGKDDHEFEFLVENKGHIIPIDVKKNKGKLNSLDDFRNSNTKYLAIKISQNNYGYDKDKMILTIPLYETFLLAKDIIENNDLV